MRVLMGNVNRKATAEEMERAREVICRAFPDCEPIFGGHSAYGGGRAITRFRFGYVIRRGNIIPISSDRYPNGSA